MCAPSIKESHSHISYKMIYCLKSLLLLKFCFWFTFVFKVSHMCVPHPLYHWLLVMSASGVLSS